MSPRDGDEKHCVFGAVGTAFCCAILVLGAGTQASAQSIDQSTDTPSSYGWREVWSGIDAANDQWLFYSGMTAAPWSHDIYSNGWRLRVGGGYGQFGYDGKAPRQPCGDATLNDPCTEAGRASQHYRVEQAYAEALVGYYLQLGALTAKAFAGASMSTEHHLIRDPSNHADGTEYGAKVALELWLNMGDEAWSSLDLSYATARSESSSRWRTGWRLEPHFSVGPELRYDRNVETGNGDWNGRAGLFARYDWVGGEVSLAGGVSSRVDDWDTADVSPYGTLNVLFQY